MTLNSALEIFRPGSWRISSSGENREPGQRSRLAYRLTEQGADLFPVLAALMQWGDRWLSSSGGPIGLRHRDCGEPVELELRCAAGHRMSPGELDLVRRPDELS